MVEGLRVEGNVIHLPKPASVEEGTSSRPTMRAGSGWSEPAKSTEANPLRSDEGEVQRTTVPPDAPEAEEAEAAEVSGEILTPAKPTADASTEPETDATQEAVPVKAPAADEKKPDEPEAKAAKKKPDEPEEKKSKAAESKGKTSDAKKDPVIARGERRDRKESLSTHLSDEAKAFFSDKSLEAAYKPHHDNFEDLTPAHEDHASEVARSRKWMRVTGLLLVGVVAVIGSFALQSRYGVQETVLRTSQFQGGAPPETTIPLPQAPAAPAPEAPATTAPEAPATAPEPAAAAPRQPPKRPRRPLKRLRWPRRPRRPLRRPRRPLRRLRWPRRRRRPPRSRPGGACGERRGAAIVPRGGATASRPGRRTLTPLPRRTVSWRAPRWPWPSAVATRTQSGSRSAR
ncbi:MAG: hypothetical protein R3A48_09025 [Polyangiales bacterium]